MSFIVGSGGCLATSTGGGTATERPWVRDLFTTTEAFASGDTLTLSETPYYAEGTGVFPNYSNGNLTQGIDYTIVGRVFTFLFGDNPANYNPAQLTLELKYQK